MSNKIIKSYISQLKSLYESDNWLDECYLKKIEKVSERQAFCKPFQYLHSIAEILSHVLEWRIVLAKRFKNSKEQVFKLSLDQNWKDNEQLKNKGWIQLCNEFKDSQEQLLVVLEPQDDEFLKSIWKESYSYEYLLEGLIHHDAYHLGQIGLIYRLVNQSI